MTVLIKHLPARESRFLREAAPDAADIAQYGPVEHILANLFDITAKAHFNNPAPYPRPADVIQQRQRDEARHAALLAQNQRIKNATEVN